jgi:hypothetical protein
MSYIARRLHSQQPGRSRSAQTLTLLLTGLLVAALLAVPDQRTWTLGAEYLALAFVVGGVAFVLGGAWGPRRVRLTFKGVSCEQQGGCSMPAQTMPPQTTNLFLLEDLEDVSRTRELSRGDREALQAVADWIKTYALRPHEDLGRAGTVCPYLPGSVERKTLWLAPEQIADREGPEVVELMSGYKRLLLDTRRSDGGDDVYNVIAVVFTDLPADRAQGVFDNVAEHLAVPSYVEDGILFGPYYEGNETTAIYNSSFRPFESPAPFLFVRHGVISDWKFFLDNEEWLNLWARHYGESPGRALAEEVRHPPWRPE